MSAAARAERILVLAPRGRDATIAQAILREAGLPVEVCPDTAQLLSGLRKEADVAIVTEEALRSGDVRELEFWIAGQPPWSDLPFIVLTEHGGGLERNPTAAQLTKALGNVTFLERPFHPTTLISVVQTNLRGRSRQYECRRLNEELESRVCERTSELAAANRQLLSQIAERERVESTLRQMQRLEAVGQLTSGVAHDFNNLLTVILGNIPFLERSCVAAGLDGKVTKRLDHMRMAAERGAKLTDQLLSFSRRQRLEPRSLDVNASITNMRDLLNSTLGGTINIETKLHPDVWAAMADPTQLELAVLNLAINARDAMGGKGTLSITTDNVELGNPTRPEEPSSGAYVCICVTDNGSGMTDDVRAKVFEPFFTTKGVGKGSGLGLSQVLGFAKQSGGGVHIHSRPNEGSRISICVPRAERPIEQMDESGGAVAPEVVSRGASILLVDDDDAVRDITATMLRDMGHSVVEAGSGGAALELLERNLKIDLALLDFSMPGMTGAELARLIRTKRPVLPILFVTGFADNVALAGVSDDFIIGKPFVDDELATKVRECLVGRPPAHIAQMTA